MNGCGKESTEESFGGTSGFTSRAYYEVLVLRRKIYHLQSRYPRYNPISLASPVASNVTIFEIGG